MTSLKLSVIYRTDPYLMCDRPALFIEALCKHTSDVLEDLREAGLYGGD